MPLSVRDKPIYSSNELFLQCQIGDAYEYAHLLKNQLHTYQEIPQKGNTIGTIDATSCISIIYKTPDQTIYVQHHDGRELNTLISCFDQTQFKEIDPVKVTLVGGCKHGKDYASLDKHAKENIEQLFKFWSASAFHIDVQGWVIGEASTYEELFSDFLVDHQHVYLLRQGQIGQLNREMQGRLIPELPRRLATVLSDNSRYFFLNPHSSKQLLLSNQKQIQHLKPFAEQLLKLDDATILKHCSTTPNIEPPYFAPMLRDMAFYVLNAKKSVEKIEIPSLSDHALFCIQGEVVQLKPHVQ